MIKDDGCVAPPTPNTPPESVTVPVIGISQLYLAPYVIDLNIRRKMLTLKEGTFSVNNTNGDQWFMFRGKMLSIHDRRVLVDIADKPLVTFQQKVFLHPHIHTIFCPEFSLIIISCKIANGVKILLARMVKTHSAIIDTLVFPHLYKTHVSSNPFSECTEIRIAV